MGTEPTGQDEAADENTYTAEDIAKAMGIDGNKLETSIAESDKSMN